MIDEGGWGRLLISTGNNFPDYNSWKLASVRFRVFDSAAGWLGDDFSHVGPFTGDGRPLDATECEVGARSWEASGLNFLDNKATTATTGVAGIGTLSYSLPTTETVSVEAQVDATGANWAGLGFLGPVGPGLTADGQIWMFQQGAAIRVRADGGTHLLYSGTPPVLNSGPNLLRLEYRPSTNEASAFVNGIPVLSSFPLSSLSFVPSIAGATIQVHQGTAGTSTIDFFRVGGGGSLIFADGFETGSTDRWQLGDALASVQ